MKAGLMVEAGKHRKALVQPPGCCPQKVLLVEAPGLEAEFRANEEQVGPGVESCRRHDVG
jgi:uncharacterized cupin superfamily protein